MAFSYKSDNLEFNENQLAAQIQVLEGIREAIKASRSAYDEYIVTQLVPSWTTDNGKKAVSDLQQFSEQNIFQFIVYLDNKISDLKVALENVKNINIA